MSPPPDTLAVGWPGWRTSTETRPRDSALVRPVRAVPLGRSADLLRASPAAGTPSAGSLPGSGHERATVALNALAAAGRPKTARGLVAVLKNKEVKANRRCI